MEDFELTLFDRLEVIRLTNQRYDLENNAYISFSGGKDSTIVHYLIDMALPNNKIPRVFCDTGIEYNDIRQFVLELAKNDERFIIIRPLKPIKQMLESVGYPFKSKQHSHNISIFQNNKDKIRELFKTIDAKPELLKDFNFIESLENGTKTLTKYYYGVRGGQKEILTSLKVIPNELKYQIETDNYNIKTSDKCCYELKKKPFKKWEKENNRPLKIMGVRMAEGGMRSVHKGCILVDKETKEAKGFKPLNPVSQEFEDWFIKQFNLPICKLYKEPYNFNRTGCKGCPYSQDLQEQLETMELYMPTERKQCEIIWKPIYEEYRRIGYRLERVEQLKLF